FVDEVIVQPDNSWTYTPTTALPEGEHIYTASSVDDVGNESAQTGPFSITVDRTSPDDITNFRGFDDVGLVQDFIENGDVIDDATPTFSGEVNAAEVAMGSTVTVIIRDENDNVVQTITNVALAAGANPGDPATWSTDPSPALGNGSYKVTAKVVDKAGNESNETDPIEFVIDTATPGAPSIVRVVDDVNDPAEDVDISDGGITNDDTPTVHGTGPSNATITLYSADPSGLSDAEKAAITLGTFTTGSDGKWNITPSDLDDGIHTFYADARGANGQVSPSTGPYTITVDTSIPNPPDITITGTLNAEDDQGDHTGPINEGDTTDDAKPRLHGTVSEPNGKVTVIIDGGTPNERSKTVDVDDQGNWEYTPEPPLTDGQHSVQIALTDEAGNGPSAPSNPLSFVVDTTAITITIDKAVDDVPNPGEPADTTKDINEGEKTNDDTPLIVGSAKVGAEVTLEVNGKTYGPVTADGNGVWQIQIPDADALPEGPVTFKAIAEDASGNEVEDTFTITIDTTPNAVPVITDADDNVGNVQGKLNNGDHTDDNTPKINGRGTAGETIRIYKDGEFVAEVVVQSDNSWTYTPTSALPEGEHIYTASSVDDVGNESAQTGPFSITVDRTAPDAVTTFAGFDDVGTYEQIVDNSVIDDNTPTFEGTVKLSDAGDGVHVKLYLDDGLGGDPVEYDNISVNDQTGAWTYDPSPALGNGTYTVYAVVVDEAGNESSASDDLTFTINTATPGAPSIVRVLDDVGNVGGRTDEVSHKGLTNDATPTIEGTGPSGATIRIYDGDPQNGGVEIDTTTVLGDGTWSYTVEDGSPLADGKHDFYADAVFGNGTPSPVTGPYTITIDTEVPDPPLTLRAFDDQGDVTGFVVPGSTIDDTTPTFSGKAEARATVHIYNEKADGTIEKLGTATADDNGDWSFQETLFFIEKEEVPYKVFVTQTDEAGNGESDPSDILDFILVGEIDINIGTGKLGVKDKDDADNLITDASQSGDSTGLTAAAKNLKANEITTSYSFENYNGDLFVIDNITGQVTLARDATAADIGEHDLTIKVSTLIITTGEERSATEQFTVNVTENVELQPITDEDADDNSIYSDASIGDEVGVTARAIDGNANDTVSYSLSNNASGLFTINTQTGVVTLARAVENSDLGTKTIKVLAESSDGSEQEMEFDIEVSNKTFENSANVLSGNWAGDSTPDGDAQVLAASADVTSTTTTFEAVAGQTYDLTASVSVNEEAGNKKIVKIEILDPNDNVIEERTVKFNGKTENDVEFSIDADAAGEYTVRVSNIAPDANVERTVSIDSIAIAGADASQLITPLVLDLDGDGTETISKTQGVKFDIDADGKLDVTGWVASDDALLVYDRNQDQQINDGSELFGAATQKADGTLAKDGFEALRELDSNQDGVFDANDDAYSHLQLWQDRNSDGQVQDGELFGLDEAGVISINLDAQTNDETDNGNIIGLSSNYTDKDGNDLSVDDVWFGYDSGAADNSEAIEIMDLIQDAEVEIPELSQARDIPAELLVGQDKANICYFDSLVGQENIDVEMIQGLVDTQKSLLDH
ncbi:MAG: Ig-like domain-containing protein, partial [Cellvibrionaceae bacterium]|nr:Ig-like domain-containing protein [Cellvibrionaceae bacterium]